MFIRLRGMVILLGGLIGCAVSRPDLGRLREGDGELHLFLLVEQSNMAGRGKVTPGREVAIPGVMALRPDGSWGSSTGSILQWDKRVAGVGIARRIKQAYGRVHPGVRGGFRRAAGGGSPVEAGEDGYYLSPDEALSLG